MKATSANFLTVLKGPKQFVIPIYQRTYSWQIAQCNKLLNDILRISRDPSVPGHFIGSVVYFQESIHTVSDVPKLLVIDGQQRITTVSLLIAALAEFIKDNETGIDTNFSKLQNYYLLNPEEESELRYKLLLTKRDKETFINIVKGVKPTGEFSLRIWENFEFFKRQISKENAADIYNGILRLFVVDVALEKDKDNPQLIFESMNSTGLDLSQADLIRNYILMGQEIKIQTELYEKYWFPMEQSYGNDYTSTFDWFMRDYLSVKSGYIPRIDRVYEEFKAYVQSNKAPKTITDVVKDIVKFSGYYVNMILHKEPESVLLQGFKNISKLKVDVSYPFLLPVYDDYSIGTISKDEFSEIISLVENYVFRRAICGIPTNSLNKTFATLYKSFSKINYLEGIKAAFQLMDSYKRFPNDAEFEKEIVAKDVYNFRSRNYLLNKLENFNRKEIVNTDDYTIEHIMPQNPDLSVEWQSMLGDNWKEIQQLYLHTLGNLTLTGYNSELSDRPFGKKKSIEGGFNDSPLRLNSFMRNVDVWNEEQIKKRAVELATKATSIWNAPNLSDDILSKYKPAEEKESATYTIENYEYLKGEMLELYYALRKRILNIDSSVKEEYKKLYIAFKSSTNFVDIVPQKARLRLSLNIEFPKIIDPHGLCKDVSGLGRWGNGDVEVGISALGELDNVMELIQQAFDEQLETT
ncbi:MAG: DUF262 domain-containing protein [Verrucomicrobia bacterium]|nr:DUF262 domain-containing protein [Verrucomicrobiota bacterium]